MKPSTNQSFLPFAHISPRTAFWAALSGMALVLPAIYALHLLSLPQPGAAQIAAKAKLMAFPTWLLALKSLLIYPVIEECVYRGVIMQLLRRYLPLWVAVLPPALLFGITHLGSGPQNAVFAFGTGLWFARLAIRSGSLLPSMFCHSAINLTVVFLLPLSVGRVSAADPAILTQPTLVALLAISIVALSASLWQLHRAPSQLGVATPATVSS